MYCISGSCVTYAGKTEREMDRQIDVASAVMKALY